MAYKSSKLFNIEDRKRHTGVAITEVDVFQWKSTLLEELRKNKDFTEHIQFGATWGNSREPNRGFTDDDAEDKAKAVDSLLTKISSCAPQCLVRSINKRSTSLDDVWTLIRDWAGIHSTGSRHLDYFRAKKSWKEDGEETRQEFFYRLKDSMEDSLLTAEDRISDHGSLVTYDEELTPCLGSIVVMDWIEAIGGVPLVEHVFRVYAKDLETNTLGSLQTRISKNLDSLMLEMQEFEQAKINRVAAKNTMMSPPGIKKTPWQKAKPNAPYKAPFSSASRQPPTHYSQPQSRRHCKLCKSSAHFISSCPSLTDADRYAIGKIRATTTQPESDQAFDSDAYTQETEDPDYTNLNHNEQDDQD